MPGDRLQNLLSDCITFDFSSVSGKTQAEFIKSTQLCQHALDDSIHAARNSPDSVTIVCDASVPSSDMMTLQSVAGWDCYYLNKQLAYED